MQVGENTYISIKVKGSGKKHILSFDTLKEFRLVETAGASLPYLCMSFGTFDEQVAGLFLQNNQIEVSIGRTEKEARTFVVCPMSAPHNQDASGSGYIIKFGGFIGDKSFMVDANKSKAYKGNSLLVIKQILKEFKGLNNTLDTNIEKVNENQVVWRQPYQTANDFMMETILHMDIAPSFPLATFDKYGKFHVKSYEEVVKDGYKWKFTPTQPKEANEIQYMNNFKVKNYKPSYDLYSGYRKLTVVCDTATGYSEYIIDENKPVLASTKEVEEMPSGNRVSLNKIKTTNVHDTYYEAFAYNTNFLVSLSSMVGMLELAGFYPDLKPTDLVYVSEDRESKGESMFDGAYLIDTIVTAPDFRNGIFKTYVYVTRDNKNNVENYIAEKKTNTLKIKRKFLQDLANAVSRTRTAIALCAQIMDGTYLSRLSSFITESKNSLLRMFSISGTMLDFTSQATFLQSLLCSGNTLMNTLLSMILPEELAFMLRDFLIDKPSARYLLSKYIDEYVPYEIRSIVTSLTDALLSVNDSLNSIAEDNGITARRIPEVAREDSSYNEEENTVSEIFQDFENNTTGLDIPFPIVTLTESQSLMPVNELRDYLATETIANLTDLGYMDNLTNSEVDEFKDILLGETPIDFTIINKINSAVGNTLLYRFWGTYGPTNEALYAWKHGKVNEDTGIPEKVIYTKSEKIDEYTRLYNENYSPYVGTEFSVKKNSDNTYSLMYTQDGVSTEAERYDALDVISNALAQLTDYYIGKGFKDRYKTIPCTKLVSATGNARLYFACPQSEKNLIFYVNSKRVTLNSFPIDLGYTDIYGNKVMYNVFYTDTGYNSNSTMLEVRQV